jgi:hypothetical protein
LNADERHEPTAAGPDAFGNLADVDDRIALVVDFDLDLDVGTENMLFGAFREQAIDAGEAVRGDRRSPPLDDISVFIVVRRLDEYDQELTFRRRPPLQNRLAPFDIHFRSAPRGPA